MTEAEKMALLEELFDVAAGAIEVSTVLDDLDEWDSVNKLSLIILMDEEFGRAIDGQDIKALKTIGDILAIMEKG